MQEANLRWFILDAHGLMFGQPRPRRAIYAPMLIPPPARPPLPGIAIPAGRSGARRKDIQAIRPTAISIATSVSIVHSNTFCPAIDTPAASQIHRPEISPDHGSRIATKELYDPAAAENAADAHAAHFLEMRRQQDERTLAPWTLIRSWSRRSMPSYSAIGGLKGRDFSNHSFAKPPTIDQDLRLTSKADYGQPKLQLTTPTEFLTRHPTQQTIAPAASSWGENGYLGVWLDESNSWIYPHLHSAARRMTEIARAHASDESALTDRVLKQLARELLLAQSSDWAFLMKTGHGQALRNEAGDRSSAPVQSPP